MAYRPLIALLIALAWANPPKVSAKESGDLVSFYWGQCALDADPKLGSELSGGYLKVCVKPEAHQSVSVNHRDHQINYDQYSRLYLGAHTLGSLGIHWSAYQILAVDDGPDNHLDIHRNTDTAIISIGRLGLNRFLFSGGKKQMGFGLGRKSKGAFLESLSSSYFWDNTDYGISATWDNLVDASAEFSVGLDDPNELILLEQEIEHLSIAARIIYDSPAWFGTRFVFSGLAHHNGERRYGIAVLNVAPNGSSSLLEWIRSRQTPDGRGQDFRQIIRLNLEGQRRANKRAYFIYDDVRHTHRFVAVGQEFFFLRNMNIRLSLAYLKDEGREREHRLYGIGGLSLRL